MNDPKASPPRPSRGTPEYEKWQDERFEEAERLEAAARAREEVAQHKEPVPPTSKPGFAEVIAERERYVDQRCRHHLAELEAALERDGIGYREFKKQALLLKAKEKKSERNKKYYNERKAGKS